MISEVFVSGVLYFAPKYATLRCTEDETRPPALRNGARVETLLVTKQGGWTRVRSQLG